MNATSARSGTQTAEPAKVGSVAERQVALRDRFPQWWPMSLDQMLDTVADRRS